MLELKKINGIVGVNGVGKTTILEAIKTGINGKPPAAHIMSGAAGAKIALDIDGVGTIQREWVVGKAAKTRLNNRTTMQASVNQTIEANFGFSSSTTEIMSSAEVVKSCSVRTSTNISLQRKIATFLRVTIPILNYTLRSCARYEAQEL